MEASKDIELVVDTSKKLMDEEQVKKARDTLLTESWVCLNGTWMPESEAYIPVENRGMMYGDGLFETMVSTNGQVILLNEHLNRLNNGLDYLGIDLQSSREEWRRLFEVGIRKNGHLGTQHIMRLQCWRNGGRGYTSRTSKGSWYLSFRAMPNEFDKTSYRLMSSSFTLSEKTVNANFLKSSNALLYVMAATEAQRKNYDDALLCNGDGYVGECSSANIFWVKDQTIYTPSIICGILQGTRRDALLRELYNQSLFSVQEGLFYIESLLEADIVFSTSTIKGIQPVHSLDAIQFGKDLDIFDRVNKIYQSTIL